MVNTDAVNIASKVIGWLYFLCWSASFYPQSIKNYNKKKYECLLQFTIDLLPSMMTSLQMF